LIKSAFLVLLPDVGIVSHKINIDLPHANAIPLARRTRLKLSWLQ